MANSPPPFTTSPTPEEWTTNLPFAWQIRTFPYGLQYRAANDMSAPYGNSLQHGYLMSADLSQTSPAKPQPKYQLHFLYNPSELNISYSAQAANTPLPAQLRPDSGVPMVGTGGNLSFSLLYDRSYEVNQPDHPASDVGVLYDVAVLNGLVGITTPMSAKLSTDTEGFSENLGTGIADALAGLSGSTGEGAISAPLGRTDVNGVMQMYPVWATFGLKRNFGEQGRFTSAMSVMKYFGYINSMSITYTHFTQSMVPVRCGISIGMTLMANNGYSVPFS